MRRTAVWSLAADVSVPGRVDSLERLHAEVDGRAAGLAAHHGERLVCKRACFGCCVDDLTVFEVEAERIRERMDGIGEAHPPGRCAFLGAEGECRVYDVRPYVCRTQGLPLRWLDHEAEAEYRDICPLNEEGEPVEELAAEECWTLGEFEERLAALQAERGELKRVRLRDLFT
jgi:Fe-S-cluster containining protein